VIAVAPAVFEELAFRGFILSGLEGLRNRWQAILISAILFGLAHAAIQQSIVTFVVGMVLGVIAVETRSLIPCVLYHATHNSITVLLSKVDTATVENSPILPWFLYSSDGVAYQYSLIPALIATAVGFLLLVWFVRNPAKIEEVATDKELPVDPTAILHQAHS
jgi:sodium transport system permease protein